VRDNGHCASCGAEHVRHGPVAARVDVRCNETGDQCRRMVGRFALVEVQLTGVAARCDAVETRRAGGYAPERKEKEGVDKGKSISLTAEVARVSAAEKQSRLAVASEDVVHGSRCRRDSVDAVRAGGRCDGAADAADVATLAAYAQQELIDMLTAGVVDAAQTRTKAMVCVAARVATVEGLCVDAGSEEHELEPEVALSSERAAARGVWPGCCTGQQAAHGVCGSDSGGRVAPLSEGARRPRLNCGCGRCMPRWRR